MMSDMIKNPIETAILPPATVCSPVEGRKYTVTHDDNTGEIFVTVGHEYDYGKINKLRDEVLAEWIPHVGQYVLYGRVYVSGGEYDESQTRLRYMIFKREMDKALHAIVKGDETFFRYFPWFLESPIYIHFESINPTYNHVLQFGIPRDYLTKQSY